MASFFYQYGIMWAVFLAGCALGVQSGELGFTGRPGWRLFGLTAGMVVFTAYHGYFSPWDLG